LSELKRAAKVYGFGVLPAIRERKKLADQLSGTFAAIATAEVNDSNEKASTPQLGIFTLEF
jgi:hypothetical protein